MAKKKDKTFTRKELYDAIWKMSLAGVARESDIPYSKLTSICKEENIPIPPAGYWTRIEFGKDVSGEKKILQGNPNKILTICENIEKPVKKEDVPVMQPKEHKKTKREIPAIISELDEKNQEKAMLELDSICVRENGRLHKQLVEYKKSALKHSSNIDPHMGYPSDSKYIQEPFSLARQVSIESLPRVFHITDAIFRSIEKIGGRPCENLGIQFGEDIVRISFKEYKTDQPHTITKEEASAIEEYENRKETYSWVRKPMIRKYDHVYNGKLSITVGIPIYDRPNNPLENQLDKILIMVLEEWKRLRTDRIEREKAREIEAERKRQEEEWRLECRKEAEKVKELICEAEDFHLSQKLRDYISAVESQKEPAKSLEWIEWAKEKADWLDPTIRRKDKHLGIKSAEERIWEEKQIRNQSVWWRY